MKRVVPMLLCLLIVIALMLPTIALAAETKAATTATSSALIVYPTAPADATAAEAKASTQWQKPGDVMNLAFALVGLFASFGIVGWGIFASRKAAI